MRSASVGFQCPDCVKEGSRDHPPGADAVRRDAVADPRITTLVLIGINVVVWVAILATGGGRQRARRQAGACCPRLATAIRDGQRRRWSRASPTGAYWQLVTSMFTHVELLHIGFNMLALYFLGPMLERVLGRARFLAVYLRLGLVGSAAVMWFSDPNSQTLGASGAIFGLMGALAGARAQGRRAGPVGAGLDRASTWCSPSRSAASAGRATSAACSAASCWAPRWSTRPRQQRSLVQWSRHRRAAGRAGRRSRIAARALGLDAVQPGVVHSWGQPCGELQRCNSGSATPTWWRRRSPPP